MNLIPQALLIPQGVRGIVSAYLSQSNPAESLSRRTLRGIRFTAQQSQKTNPAIPQPLHGTTGLEDPEIQVGVGGHR